MINKKGNPFCAFGSLQEWGRFGGKGFFFLYFFFSMLTIAKQNIILLDDEYSNYRELIENVQRRLRKDIELLGFEDDTDMSDAIDFVDDKGNYIIIIALKYV